MNPKKELLWSPWASFCAGGKRIVGSGALQGLAGACTQSSLLAKRADAKRGIRCGEIGMFCGT